MLVYWRYDMGILPHKKGLLLRALYGFQTPGIFMDTHTLAHTLRQLKNGTVMISDVGVSYLR